MARRPPDRMQQAAMDYAESQSAASWSMRRRLLTFVPMGLLFLLIGLGGAWFIDAQGVAPVAVWLGFGVWALLWIGMMTLNILRPGQWARSNALAMTPREADLSSNRGWGTPDIPPWPPSKDDHDSA